MIGEHLMRFDMLDEIDREFQRRFIAARSRRADRAPDEQIILLRTAPEAALAEFESRPFCVLMMGPDHFKEGNDIRPMTGSQTLEEIGGSSRALCVRATWHRPLRR